jgi:hypothetical protein
VRSEVEAEEAGKVRGSVNIPTVNAQRQYSASEDKKVLVQEPNREFTQQVQRRFPSKQAPLLVCGSADGRSAREAVDMLKRAGYSNVVELG